MKAAVLVSVNDMNVRSVNDPQLLPGDLLIKIKAATICGTDIRILRGKKTTGIRYPSILGHEFAGVVTDNGGHQQFHVGQPVTVCPAFACGHCSNCIRGAENLCGNLVAMGYEIDGAFAEYVRVPAHGVAAGNVFPLPEKTSFACAALAEPLACVLNGQQRAGVKSGDCVAILGAGPIGLLHIKLAKHMGARRIIVSQTSASRRRAALEAGADHVIDPSTEDAVERVLHLTDGIGADVAICAIGKPELANDAVHLVRPRGSVNLFAGFTKGVQADVDVNAIHYKELTVTGAFGLTRDQFETALKLIASGEIEVESLLTHQFDLSHISEALATAERGEALKVAIVGE